MRSLLFTPGDSERKIAKAMAGNADVVILDLEDSVAPQNKAQARDICHDALSQKTNKKIYIRINALDTGLTEDDLEAVITERPDGFVLPKSVSGADVNTLCGMIETLAKKHGQHDYTPPIIAIATETAASLFNLDSYQGCTSQLVALCWGAEDLSADLGAIAVFDENGEYTAPYQLARSLCLIGARAAGAEPIDGLFSDFRDMEGLRAACKRGLREGFSGMLAIHPAQIDIINEVFTPSKEDIAQAEAVIQAFEDAGYPGVIGLDGKMLDRPHLLRAHKLVKRAALYAPSSPQ